MGELRKECIYCRQTDQNRFKGVEHVVPQSFGRFSNDTPTLDCVCDDYNAFFGRELDQVLARETYEGISRYQKGQLSSEARRQRRITITLGEGPETGEFAGARVFVDGTTGRLMPLPAQFHVLNLRDQKMEVYFIDQIPGLKLPPGIYGEAGAADRKGSWKCKILASSEGEHRAMVDALQKAGIDFQPAKPFSMPAIESATAPDMTLPVTIDGVVDKLHKRALAKILMNFIAHYLGRDEALKPRWYFLRRYVRFGEGEIKARMTGGPFWTGQETDDLRFSSDSINIRIENLNGNIVGAMQFYNLPLYEMILAENDSLEFGMEIGRRYTPGKPPIVGEKRQK